MTAKLRLELLGGLRLTYADALLTHFVSGKAPALLSYLAVTDRPHFRAALAGLLWSDLPEDDARRNLRVVLANLRHLLAPHLVITRETIAFDGASSYWLDVEQFERALQPDSVQDMERLREAVGLYSGDFLEGFYVRDAPLFDEWVLAQRERLRQFMLHALHRLINYHTERQEYAAGIDYAMRLLALDPWQEDAYRHLMLLLALSGQQSTALAQYEACCRMLDAELGTTPSENTVEVYEQIRAGIISPPPRKDENAIAAPPRGQLPVRKLPPQPTAFLGREVELAQIGQRLGESGCRLLTLVGPGGAGKTRLSLQAAANYADAFPDGAVFVTLASIESVDQMVAVVAAALGVAFAEQREPLAQLVAYVRDKHLLLVLDNMEHLPDSVGLIAALLEAAPRLTILATSRERLHLQAEWLLNVQGLAYPLTEPGAFDDGLTAAQLESYSAVQLFLHRATQVQPDFALSGADIQAVIHICQLVHGMPLGIELAAAWVRTVSCAQIAEEIAYNLDFLSTTLWDVPARHRSLRAVFNHSWALLNKQEQQVLAKLAVFRGGFESEPARVVAGATLATLASLIDKSLLQKEPSGRYAFHEALRQFAAEHLAADAEQSQNVQAEHSRYYLIFVRVRESALSEREPQHASAQLRTDLDNIRAAWQWAVAHGRIDMLDGAGKGLADFYDLGGLFQEGAAVFGETSERVQQFVAYEQLSNHSWQIVLGKLKITYARFLTLRSQFTRAAEIIREAEELARVTQAVSLEAEVCQQRGETLWRQADYAGARQNLERGVELARTVGLPQVEINSLLSLGRAALWQGDYPAVAAYQEQALRLSRTLGNRRGEGTALNSLGLLALWQGDVATARTLQEQALHCFQSIGHQAGEGFTLTCLGHGAQAFHNFTEAWHYYDQALHVSRAIGDRFGESLALACIGYVPFHQGNYDGAWTYFQQALQLHCEIGDRRGESDMLAILGLLAHLLEDNANARELCEQALHIAQELGNQPFQSRALTFLGHALVGLDRLDEAVHAYEQAVTLRNALNQAFLAMEPRAGLARIALRQEDLVQAEAHVAAILDYLDTGKLDGVFEPLRIYLTCYDVLWALNDPRAEGLLVTAYRLLHEWRDALSDPVAQRWLLENVVVHRTIVAEYAQVMHDADVLVQRGP